MDPIHPIRPTGSHPAPVEPVRRVRRPGEDPSDEQPPRRERRAPSETPARPAVAGDGGLDVLA